MLNACLFPVAADGALRRNLRYLNMKCRGRGIQSDLCISALIGLMRRKKWRFGKAGPTVRQKYLDCTSGALLRTGTE